MGIMQRLAFSLMTGTKRVCNKYDYIYFNVSLCNESQEDP